MAKKERKKERKKKAISLLLRRRGPSLLNSKSHLLLMWFQVWLNFWRPSVSRYSLLLCGVLTIFPASSVLVTRGIRRHPGKWRIVCSLLPKCPGQKGELVCLLKPSADLHAEAALWTEGRRIWAALAWVNHLEKEKELEKEPKQGNDYITGSLSRVLDCHCQTVAQVWFYNKGSFRERGFSSATYL